MNCGNCGKSNDYDAKVCVQCGSTLALTEYFRPAGFVEKKNAPEEQKKEPWDQEILTAGYKKKKKNLTPEEDLILPELRKKGGSSAAGKNTSPEEKTATHSRTTGSDTKNPQPEQKAQPTKAKSTPKPISEKKERKEISSSRIYNHTTKKLSIAEKTVNKSVKKTEKQSAKENRRKWIFPVIMIAFLLLAGAAIFVGTMNAGSREDRFKQVAEDFVYAVVMNDETKAANCIHPKMYGSVRAMHYENAQRCETSTVSMEQLDSASMELELAETYGITDPISELYRIRVGYTVYGELTYGSTETIDVLVAQIAGQAYAVKTENIPDIP